MEDLCVSVIGNCCWRRPGFRVLCPLLQPFGLHLFYFVFYCYQLILKNIRVYIAEKESLNKSWT